MKSIWLVTGADGYLGKRIVQRLLEQGDHEIVAWMRASHPVAREEKTKKILSLIPSQFHSRIEFSFGDLEQDEPYSNLLASEKNTVITGIIHGAAVTKFNVASELADSINKKGTEKTVHFARTCKNLKQFIYVSTVYATGLTQGEINETFADPKTIFANHYERSKCESEWLFRDLDLPFSWKIARVATLLAQGDSGKVEQYNVFHNTLKLMFYGLISVLPGYPQTPVYLVTSQFTEDAILAIIQAKNDRKIYHLCPTALESLTLGALVDLAFEEFSQDSDFVHRRILRPLFTDQDAFEKLANALKSMSGGVLSQAIGSMVPFAHQLFIRKEFKNENLLQVFREAFKPTSTLDIEKITRETVRQLVKTRWGTRSPVPSLPSSFNQELS